MAIQIQTLHTPSQSSGRTDADIVRGRLDLGPEAIVGASRERLAAEELQIPFLAQGPELDARCQQLAFGHRLGKAGSEPESRDWKKKMRCRT